MLIDLSVFRLFLKDKFDEAIFNAKMKGYSINRHQIAAVFTAALILGCSDEAAAYEGTIRIDESLRGNIYSVIFALIETLKLFSISDIKNTAIYFNNIRK